MEDRRDLEKNKLPGCLVRNIRDDAVGVVVCKDSPHSDYWKVLSEGEIVSWFETNIVGIDDEQFNGIDVRHISR